MKSPRAFYLHFIPEVKEESRASSWRTSSWKSMSTGHPGHRWLKDGMSKEQLQKIQEFYRQRYGEGDKK